MKKIGKSSELLWLLGITLVAIGVALCSKTDLGVSMIAAPAFILHDVISPLWSGFSVGVAEYTFQGILLISLCVIIRKFNWRYLLAFAVAVIYGYVLDLFLWLFDGITAEALWQRWLLLIAGDTITALGVACFFKTYMPLQVYELFVAETAARFKFNINKTKWSFDLSLLAISVILAVVFFARTEGFDIASMARGSFHNIGLGTIATTLINSPIIAIMGKLLSRLFDPTPCFKKLYSILKIDK